MSNNEGRSSEEDVLEDPREEAGKTWQMGRELGLYVSEEEDIMAVLQAKNKEKNEKKKASKRKKGRSKKGNKASKSGAQSKSK